MNNLIRNQEKGILKGGSADVLGPTTGKVAGYVYEFLKLKIDLRFLLNSYPWLELTGGSDGNYEPSDNILFRLPHTVIVVVRPREISWNA